MTTLTTIEIAVDTSGVERGKRALDEFAGAGTAATASTDTTARAIDAEAASVTRLAAALKAAPPGVKTPANTPTDIITKVSEKPLALAMGGKGNGFQA